MQIHRTIFRGWRAAIITTAALIMWCAANPAWASAGHKWNSYDLYGIVENLDSPDEHIPDLPIDLIVRSNNIIRKIPVTTKKEKHEDLKKTWFFHRFRRDATGSTVAVSLPSVQRYTLDKEPEPWTLTETGVERMFVHLRTGHNSANYPIHLANRLIDRDQTPSPKEADLHKAISIMQAFNRQNSRYETLHLEVKLLHRLSEAGFMPNHGEAQSAFFMTESPGFEDLSGSRKFSVLSDLAYAFWRYQDQRRAIESGLRLLDATTLLLEKSIAIGENSKSVGRSLIAREYQRKYLLEKSNGEPLKAIGTIETFLKKHGGNQDLNGAALSALALWIDLLDEHSGYGSYNETEEAFISRMSGTAVADLWNRFFVMAYSKEIKTQIDLAGSQNRKQSDRIKFAAQRAEKIVQRHKSQDQAKGGEQ